MARIFVVEDDASLREELMRLLELQGHTALTGTAFDRIVDDVLAAAPDCVILDLKLPGTGGHTVPRSQALESSARHHAHVVRQRVRRGSEHEPRRR